MNSIEKIFAESDVATVYLFGSRSRNENDSKSDYDFGILLAKNMSISGLTARKFKLIKQLIRYLKKPSDVIMLNSPSIPLSFKFRIIREGKIIFDNNSIYRSRFESHILSLYFDRRYYYQRHIAEVIENTAQKGLL